MKRTWTTLLFLLLASAVVFASGVPSMVSSVEPDLVDAGSETGMSGGCGLKMKPLPPPEYQGFGCVGSCSGECAVQADVDPTTNITTYTCICAGGSGSGPDCELEVKKRPGTPPLFSQKCIDNSCSGTCSVNDDDPVWIWCECP